MRTCAEDIGGVMGGANSEITSATKRVVFEAAYFAPAQIRATSKALGLKTEASTRFERGMDRTAPPRAMARALELLEKIGAGKPTGAITDNYPRPLSTEAVGARTRADRRIARHGSAGCGRRSYSAVAWASRSASTPPIMPAHGDAGGWDVICAVVASRHPSPGRSDRRSRAPLRIRASADDVPRC